MYELLEFYYMTATDPKEKDFFLKVAQKVKRWLYIILLSFLKYI
jgi:hypothetical protein